MSTPTMTVTETEVSPAPLADAPANGPVLPARVRTLGDPNAGLTSSDTATLDAEMLSALTAMDAAHKIREANLAPTYATVVQHLGRALLAAVRIEGFDSAGAVREVRKRLMTAAKARTESPRVAYLANGGTLLPADKQPKPRPGTYIQAYTRVLDLARWTPGVDMFRVVDAKRGRSENPLSMASDYVGVVVQGTMYESPVVALNDGRTLESVHQAWLNVVRPVVIDLESFAAQAPAAVKAAFGKYAVVVKRRDEGSRGGAFTRKARVFVKSDPAMLGAVVLAALEEASKHEGWRDKVLEVVEKYREVTEAKIETK